MFDNLRQAFREAVDNFKDELGRDEIPEAVSRLLREMKREAADTKAEIRRLEEAIRGAIEKSEKEEASAKTCRRREQMALDISDEETARVAREYAEKHEHRKTVLEHKAVALKEELDMRQGEFAEMIEAIKEAEKNREGLAATAGRASARNSIEEADDLFSQLDRFADEIEGEDVRREANVEVDDLLDDGEDRFESRPDPLEEIDFDARLEALKRAMGEQGKD
jgi:phage shock protein A